MQQPAASGSGAASLRVPGGREHLRPETAFFGACWVLLLLIGRERLFRDPGTFWHTVVGERMLVTGQPIRSDPFTFTFGGTPWIAHQWLGECLMALAHRVGGLDTLLLLTAALIASVLAWIAGRLMRAGLHWVRTAGVIALVLAVSASHLHVRPHLASIALLALTVAVLIDVEGGRIRPSRLAWLVPLFVLWANVHGGVLGGLGTLGLVLSGFLARRRVQADATSSQLRAVAFGFGVLGACAMAVALVSPYGLELPRTWLAIMESPTLTRLIVEHRPLELASMQAALVGALALLYLGVLASTWPRRPRVSWLLPLVWLYLAWSRVRHGPLFAVTAALALADMLPFSPLARRTAHAAPSAGASTGASTTWRAWLLPALLVAGGLALQAAGARVPLVGRGWARLDPSHWPVELLGELRAHQHDVAGGTPIFNEYVYGGFLEYFTPGYRVFVDDRCELYRDAGASDPDRWLDELVRAERVQTRARMRQWEQRYGRFDLALVRTRAPNARAGFDLYFRAAQEWRAVKRTATATLYRRRR